MTGTRSDRRIFDLLRHSSPGLIQSRRQVLKLLVLSFVASKLDALQIRDHVRTKRTIAKTSDRVRVTADRYMISWHAAWLGAAQDSVETQICRETPIATLVTAPLPPQPGWTLGCPSRTPPACMLKGSF
ncbi:unnamed protein product [Phytophthora lilii]|uniref:Unnamed protein product n=1 Tax=Phytophthora lilii TaxID=2077276 RepID=A0A9W6TD45_9STRA|nr:unnamed protein product [Phytophthora lilii]